MAGTTKSIAFAAPYTSTTFNAEEALNVGQNGVMTGMSVTTSAGIATIQPGSFVQNGLITTISAPISNTVPSTLVAPYSIVVTTSSSIQNLGEVITPTFIQRPEDVSPNSVIVADWDGAEWHPRPQLQIAQLLAAQANNAVLQQFVGIAQGFNVTASSGTVSVASGNLIDQQGVPFEKTLSTNFTATASDVDSLLRTDEIVFRRPNDDPSRAGSIQYITGPTYNSSGTVQSLHKTQIGSSSATNIASKVLNVSSNNSTLFLYLSGTNLRFTSYADLMSTQLVAPVTVATGVTAFDAVIGPTGNVEIAYTTGDNTYYMQVSTAGAVTYAALEVASHSTATTNPKIVTVTSGSTYMIHIVYELVVSGSVHQLWYVQVNSSDTQITDQLLLVDLSAVVTNPSLAKDDTDSLLLLAYENSTTGKTYFREYDASTATALSIPTQIGTTLELETDTLIISSETVVSGTTSTQCRVRRAANKETYVFWLQNKGSGNYGIAVYNRMNLATFGHMSYIQDLVVSGENITMFDVSLDGLCNAHFTLGEGGSVYKASLQLESGAVLGTTTAIDTNTPTGIGTKFTSRGSLVHFWSYVSGSNTVVEFVKTTAGVFTNLRGFAPIHTDVALAHYRSTDGAVAACGRFIDEHQAITRIYEFLSCFGATGQISWGITAASQLAFTSPITLNFYNRVSTYSVAAIPAGISIPAGYAAVVQIPDADSTSTLTLSVVAFGAGILDRNNRNIFPLFWNVGGVLYTRFSPFRVTSGEIINLGDQISQEMLTWLGASGVAPSATHTYSSTTYISDTQSHETAIGALDAALTAFPFGSVVTFTATVGQSFATFTKPVAVYLSPGSADSGRTAGAAYPADTSIANGPERYEFVGFIETYVASGNVVVTSAGIVGGFTGLTPGAIYYVDPANPGLITSTEPTTASQWVVPVGMAVSATSLVVNAALSTSGYKIVTAASFAWPNYFVTTESDLTSAITNATTNGGGVICFQNAVTLASSHTIPSGTIVTGRRGGSLVTVTTGSLTLSTGTKVENLWFTTANTSGSMVLLPNNYSIIRECQFTIPAASTGQCVLVTGSANKLYNNVFVGVAAETATGINVTSGVDNAYYDSVYLP